MQHARSARRAALLALSLLFAGAAGDPPSPATARQKTTGAFSDFLIGRFALSQSDPTTAANQLLRAHMAHPEDQELLQQAFIASLIGGRPESVSLARQLPDSQAARLLLGEVEARAGHWQAAEQRFRALPTQGYVQVLQPLLVAWAQQGAGQTDAALGTLRPLVEGQRFRGVYALHAALIADQAGRNSDAARLYRIAQTEFGGSNLRLGQILASWQTRQGHFAEAQRTLALMADDAPEMAIALPALVSATSKQPVPSALDGIAEAYLALAAAMRQQDSRDFSMLLVRLALDLRPDFTPARLLAADILENGRHYEKSLQMLSAVTTDDPLISVVRLRRAALAERMGHAEEAMHDLQRLAQDYPDSPLPLMREGDSLRSSQRFAEAAEAYGAAIARIKQPRPSDWIAYYDRGICYERARDWAKAEADFRFALTLAPDQPFVLNYLGYSWADMGTNLPEARAMIEKAVQRRPNDGAMLDSLGWVMLRQGETENAVQMLERAVELDPADPAINGHLGDAYWAAGRKLEATFQWQRALTFNPEPDDAAKLEAKLQTSRPVSVVSGQ